MSDERYNSQPNGNAARLSQLERVQLRRGLYVPQRLIDETEDALKAMALNEGYADTNGLSKIKIEFALKMDGKEPIIDMDYFGYLNKPYPFTQTNTALQEYARAHNIKIKEVGDTRIVLQCKHLRPLIDAILEGFIQRYGKDFAINYESIMKEDAARRGWEYPENYGTDKQVGLPQPSSPRT